VFVIDLKIHRRLAALNYNPCVCVYGWMRFVLQATLVLCEISGPHGDEYKKMAVFWVVAPWWQAAKNLYRTSVNLYLTTWSYKPEALVTKCFACPTETRAITASKGFSTPLNRYIPSGLYTDEWRSSRQGIESDCLHALTTNSSVFQHAKKKTHLFGT
jgi:hypothetical protein